MTKITFDHRFVGHNALGDSFHSWVIRWDYFDIGSIALKQVDEEEEAVLIVYEISCWGMDKIVPEVENKIIHAWNRYSKSCNLPTFQTRWRIQE